MAEEEIKNKDPQTEEHAEEELPEHEEGGNKKKKIIYIAIFVAQIIAAVILVKFFIFPWYSGNEEDVSAQEQQENQQIEKKKEIGTIYKLPVLTVNPKGSRGRRFAVFEIAFSIQKEIMLEDIQKYEPVLADNLIRYFRSKTVADLSVDTVMSVIKNDIMRISIDVVGENKINDIFFTNFILQ